MTGPSHPYRGSIESESGEQSAYRLPRSNEGRDALRIAIPAAPGLRGAWLEWRRYPTDEPFQAVRMGKSDSDEFEAAIDRLPAAGKVEYVVVVLTDDEERRLPAAGTVVARFRDPVPAGILVPHILAMFGSMLVSTRALFEVIRRGAPSGRTLILVAMGLLVIGGLVLGPVVQKHAFGAYWTGWPFGTDLTDNKTLVAFLAWLPATIAAARGLRTRAVAVLGWIVMMGVFLIPHSMRGSELDWSQVDPATGIVLPIDSGGGSGPG
jgi:hypothetical protein